MYHLRPLAGVPDNIELPKCMYHIKPITGIHTTTSLPEDCVSVTKVKMDPELQAIEDRQLQVIARLRQLRDTVKVMISKQDVKAGSQQVKTGDVIKTSIRASKSPNVNSCLANAALPDELVIEACPSRPPLSLILFRKQSASITTTSHVHSKCKKGVDPKLVSMFSLENPTSTSTIRVVWKDGIGIRLTPPTLESCVIEGESNVARYLSRVLAKPESSLNYDALSEDDLVLVDSVLESSECVDIAPDCFLTSLQTYVQRKGASSSRTIADFVGYSTLRYLTKQRPQQSLQKSLIDWMNCLTNEVPSLC